MLVDSAASSSASGVERSTAAVVAALRARGVRVTLVTPTLGEKPQGTDVLGADMRDRYLVLRGYRPWTESVHRVLDGLAPDIVHGQGLLHHGMAAARWSACPTVVTAHGNPMQDARWHYPRLLLPVLVPLLRHIASDVIRSADALVNVCPDWSVNCPIEPRNWAHISNPVDDLFFACATPDAVDRVLYFGGTRHIKGLDVLLDCWPAVLDGRPTATLHVWGMPVGDESRLADRCRRTSGCAIEGVADSSDVAGAMHQGGVVVVPSRFEVAPLTLLEAWAAGVPAVASAVGGIPALASGAAALCPPEDAAALAREIVRMLRRGTEVDAMVTRGRVLSETHRASAVAEAHVALYERLLG
jgi:glycosyltransferase involved in cell wall biosynthesis